MSPLLPSSRRLPLSLGLLGSGALLLVALSSYSQPSGAPAPSVGSAAAPAGPPPLIRGADIPAETSEVPTTKEWEDAKVVRANQDEKKICSLKVLREWVRFECDHRLGASLVAGDPADVKIWAWGEPGAELPWSTTTRVKPKTLFTMRLRRGDAKIYELYELGWTYEGYTWAEPAEKIAVTWREGKADPVILVQK